jgi:hypothetical protein
MRSIQLLARLPHSRIDPNWSAAVLRRSIIPIPARPRAEGTLGRFDVTVISRYFPEFERELPRYLSQP